MGFERFWDIQFHTDDVAATSWTTARGCAPR